MGFNWACVLAFVGMFGSFLDFFGSFLDFFGSFLDFLRDFWSFFGSFLGFSKFFENLRRKLLKVNLKIQNFFNRYFY